MSVQGRTVLEFQTDRDVWGTLDRWAEDNKYELQSQDASGRLYQKGKNLLVVPLMVAVASTGAAYHLEAWVRFPTLNRIMSLGMLPEEAHIYSEGGKIGFVPRNKLRKEVNLLLEELGVQQIQ